MHASMHARKVAQVKKSYFNTNFSLWNERKEVFFSPERLGAHACFHACMQILIMKLWQFTSGSVDTLIFAIGLF